MVFGGETNAIYYRYQLLLMKIKTNIDPVEEYTNSVGEYSQKPLGRAETLSRETSRRVSESTNLAREKERGSVGENKYSAEELNQHKRPGIPKGLTAWGTSNVLHLRTCYPLKCC